MCERLIVAIALAALAAGGCAVSPPASTDAASRQPLGEGPSNFASPTDLFQRYPTMRRQEL